VQTGANLDQSKIRKIPIIKMRNKSERSKVYLILSAQKKHLDEKNSMVEDSWRCVT
jgi:hypothetical protein